MKNEAQYDAVANTYNVAIKKFSFYEKLIDPTVRHMLGDVKGKVYINNLFNINLFYIIIFHFLILD